MSKTDFANSLKISNFLVKCNTCLYSAVISHSCFRRYLSKKNSELASKVFKGKVFTFYTEDHVMTICVSIFFSLCINEYNQTSLNQTPLHNTVWCFFSL